MEDEQHEVTRSRKRETTAVDPRLSAELLRSLAEQHETAEQTGQDDQDG